MTTHEVLGDNRLRFSSKLAEMSDELNNIAKEVEKSRKIQKDTGSRFERILQEQEALTEKAKLRYDTALEEVERINSLREPLEISPPFNFSASSPSTLSMSPQSNHLSHIPFSASSMAVKNVGKVVKSGRGLFRGKTVAQVRQIPSTEMEYLT